MRLGFRDNLQVVNDLAIAKIGFIAFARFSDFMAECAIVFEVGLDVAFSGGNYGCEEVAHDYLLLGACAFLNAIAGP